LNSLAQSIPFSLSRRKQALIRAQDKLRGVEIIGRCGWDRCTTFNKDIRYGTISPIF
jgi:hypothetical protein